MGRCHAITFIKIERLGRQIIKENRIYLINGNYFCNANPLLLLAIINYFNKMEIKWWNCTSPKEDHLQDEKTGKNQCYL